ncbi:unnamed protein product [Cuscuta campestris]|uniref:Uncharacterized protein n=1 Tax=Cuscuta campestris TaxID=132261 RepID=A0A484L4G6_9ASTE|nr:unnamed protein product [Cuscuta campestris]
MQLVSMICMEAAAAADNKQRKCPTKLDLSAPLLSARTRRASILPNDDDAPQLTAESDGDDICKRIPFSWEETAGKPKRARDVRAVCLVPSPPPGRTYDEGSVESRELLLYSDALDAFSSSDEEEEESSSSSDEGEGFERADFIFTRFLKDAEALATSGRGSRGWIVSRPAESCFARAALSVGQMLYEPPCCGRACGRDILPPWRMKVEQPCGGGGVRDSVVAVASSRGKEIKTTQFFS